MSDVSRNLVVFFVTLKLVFQYRQKEGIST
jgi:hypothetical protein